MPKMNIKKSRVVVAEMMRETIREYEIEIMRLQSTIDSIYGVFVDGEGTPDERLEKIYAICNKSYEQVGG